MHPQATLTWRDLCGSSPGCWPWSATRAASPATPNGTGIPNGYAIATGSFCSWGRTPNSRACEATTLSPRRYIICWRSTRTNEIVAAAKEPKIMHEIPFRCVAPYVCPSCGFQITIRPCPACCASGVVPPDQSIHRPVTRRDRPRRVRLTLAALARAAGRAKL